MTFNSDAVFRASAEAQILRERLNSQNRISPTGEEKESIGLAGGAELQQQNRKVPKVQVPESIDGLEIFTKIFQEQQPVLKGLLFTGLTLFAGRPKVGKSWLTLQMALEVARGNSLLNRFQVERAGRVVYAALEEPQRRTHCRLRKFLTSEEVALQNIHFIYDLLPLMSGGAAQLDAFLNQYPATMLIIDTLAAVVRSGGSQRDVMRSDYAEVTALRHLAERHDTAVVAVTHLRKMSAGVCDRRRSWDYGRHRSMRCYLDAPPTV